MAFWKLKMAFKSGIGETLWQRMWCSPAGMWWGWWRLNCCWNGMGIRLPLHITLYFHPYFKMHQLEIKIVVVRMLMLCQLLQQAELSECMAQTRAFAITGPALWNQSAGPFDTMHFINWLAKCLFSFSQDCSSLWVSHTGSASDWCALQEALYKCIDTIQ